MLSLIYIIHADVEILTIYGETSEVCVALEITAQVTEGKLTPGNYLINIPKTPFYNDVLKKYYTIILNLWFVPSSKTRF